MSLFIFLSILIALTITGVILMIVLLVKHSGSSQNVLNKKIDDYEKKLDSYEKNLKDEFERNRKETSENERFSRRESQETLLNFQNSVNGKLDNLTKNTQDSLTSSLTKFMESLSKRFDSLSKITQDTLNNQKQTMQISLKEIQDSNEKKLEQMRMTVDEKLQKSLDEKFKNSFNMIAERLDQVHKGLGEMQNIAVGVGDLKKVLDNVKTRGNLGEVQLASILEQIMAPGQYEEQAHIYPKKDLKVDFAIRYPGSDENQNVYLPIDAKFPGETYAALQDAYETGDKDNVESAWKILETEIKKEAKSIHDKYIYEPVTTPFAVMFLPFEGLYAEIARRNMVELLQREYCVTIAGPSTMAAMLSSLLMGFRTLQIQKRSAEVWNILSAVKTEFNSFAKVFASAQTRIRQLDEDMDKLIGVRTRQIQKALKNVQELDVPSSEVLEIESDIE